MGSAKILENRGNGRYRVQPVINDLAAHKLMDSYSKQLKDLTDTQIPVTESLISDANSSMLAAHNNLTRVMNRQFSQTSQSDLESATSTYLTTKATHDSLRKKLDSYQLQVTALQNKLNHLKALVTQSPKTIWCTDCSLDLSGEVSTIELYGLPTHSLIAPGYTDDAKLNISVYGQNTPTAYISPEAAFYNACLFPGWQKWRPTFRAAYITSLYGDLCSVEIYDPRTDEEVGLLELEVDYNTTYTNVEVSASSQYTISDFSEGDLVVIQFPSQDYSSPPVIIGFYEYPCGGTSTSTTTTTLSTTTSTTTTSSSSSSSTSTSSTSSTTITGPPTVWYTVQAESGPLQSDGCLYHFLNMAFDAGDLDHTDGPSAHGVDLYSGLTYIPSGYCSIAQTTLIKYTGDSNLVILSTIGPAPRNYSDITYDIPNSRLILACNVPGQDDIYIMVGENLTVSTSFNVPDPPDLYPSTDPDIGGIAVDSGTLLLTQYYTRNDSVLVYRILRVSYAGVILNNYQTVVMSAGTENVINACMSYGNTGTFITLRYDKKVEVYDSGLANPPTTYSIAHLPITNAPNGIATNYLAV